MVTVKDDDMFREIAGRAILQREGKLPLEAPKEPVNHPFACPVSEWDSMGLIYENELFGITNCVLHAHDILRRDRHDNYCMRVFNSRGVHIGYHRFVDPKLDRISDDTPPYKGGYYAISSGIAYLRGFFSRKNYMPARVTNNLFEGLMEYLPHDMVSQILVSVGISRFILTLAWSCKYSTIIKYGGLPIIGVPQLTEKNVKEMPIPGDITVLCSHPRVANYIKKYRPNTNIISLR